jgi:hypothetical protein
MPFLTPIQQHLAEQIHLQIGTASFPVDVEKAILNYSPLSIVKLSRPMVSDVIDWLRLRHINLGHDLENNRELFGCVVLFAGKGFIFVDGNAPLPEQRFTLAHEYAHYLLDYAHPRQQALLKLGLGIQDVLDGKRRPFPEERVDAVLANVHISLYKHLMVRPSKGLADALADRAEAAADELALELLAPHRGVLHLAGVRPRLLLRDEVYERVFPMLVEHYCLPRPIAQGYAHRIAGVFSRDVSVREWLGL